MELVDAGGKGGTPDHTVVATADVAGNTQLAREVPGEAAAEFFVGHAAPADEVAGHADGKGVIEGHGILDSGVEGKRHDFYGDAFADALQPHGVQEFILQRSQLILDLSTLYIVEGEVLEAVEPDSASGAAGIAIIPDQDAQVQRRRGDRQALDRRHHHTEVHGQAGAGRPVQFIFGADGQRFQVIRVICTELAHPAGKVQIGAQGSYITFFRERQVVAVDVVADRFDADKQLGPRTYRHDVGQLAGIAVGQFRISLRTQLDTAQVILMPAGAQLDDLEDLFGKGYVIEAFDAGLDRMVVVAPSPAIRENAEVDGAVEVADVRQAAQELVG